MISVLRPPASVGEGDRAVPSSIRGWTRPVRSVFDFPGAGGNDANAGHWIARQRSAKLSSGEVAAVLCRARWCSDLTVSGSARLGSVVTCRGYVSNLAVGSEVLAGICRSGVSGPSRIGPVVSGRCSRLLGARRHGVAGTCPRPRWSLRVAQGFRSASGGSHRIAKGDGLSVVSTRRGQPRCSSCLFRPRAEDRLSGDESPRRLGGLPPAHRPPGRP
jgi:hypothetical protein